MSMPHKDSRRAPRYEGKPKKLLDFFEEFEEYADAAQLDNDEKAKWVVKYVESREERSFWKLMDEYTAKPKDYAALKETILDQYPGARERRHYTRKALARLVEETADKSMKTEDRLVKYYEKFYPMAMSLIEEGKITESDMNTHFWNGIPEATQSRIFKHTRKIDPNHDRRSAPTVEVVLEAGRYILSNRNSLRGGHNPNSSKKGRRRSRKDVDSSDDESSSEEESEEESEAEEARRQSKVTEHGRVKYASSTGATKATSLDELDDLTTELYQLDITETRYAEIYFRICSMLPASATSFLAPPITQGYPSERQETSIAPSCNEESYFEIEPQQENRDAANDETLWDAATKPDAPEAEMEEIEQENRVEEVATQQTSPKDIEYEERTLNQEEIEQNEIDEIEWSAAADLEMLYEMSTTTETAIATERREPIDKERRSQVSEETETSKGPRADSKIENDSKKEEYEPREEKANIENSPATSTVHARAYSLYQNLQTIANCFTAPEISTESAAARKKLEVFERASIETLRRVVRVGCG